MTIVFKLCLCVSVVNSPSASDSSIALDVVQLRPAVTAGQSSVRKGEAGSPSEL
jgi:hypothetical protein